jgi:hypothetical protein
MNYIIRILLVYYNYFLNHSIVNDIVMTCSFLYFFQMIAKKLLFIAEKNNLLIKTDLHSSSNKDN